MLKHFTFLLFISTFVFGQTAEEIIQKHFENTGGYKNWNSLNSIYLKGTVSVGVGENFPVEIYQKRPYFKTVYFLVNGTNILNEGYDGTYGWTFNAEQNKNIRLMNYIPDSFETDILNYDKKGFTASYEGKEMLDGINTHKIKLSKNDNTSYFWFDSINYTLLKEQTNLETVRYRNNKKVNGYEFSHRIEATPNGGEEYVLILDEVRPNAAIPDETFKFN